MRQIVNVCQPELRAGESSWNRYLIWIRGPLPIGSDVEIPCMSYGVRNDNKCSSQEASKRYRWVVRGLLHWVIRGYRKTSFRVGSREGDRKLGFLPKRGVTKNGPSTSLFIATVGMTIWGEAAQ